jgi:hypothetical protein
MDSKRSMAVALGGCLLVLTAGKSIVFGADDANPYAVISERNVFRLNPPPPPPAPEEAPPPEKSTIKITGIVKMNGTVRALFVSQPKDPKETPTYFNLAEGEREGILEVVHIHPEEQKIEILNAGKPETLSIKDDSLAKNEGPPPAAPGAPAGAPNAVAPRMPQIPNLGNRRVAAPAFPGMVGAQNPGGAAGGTPYALPPRTRRTPSPVGQ